MKPLRVEKIKDGVRCHFADGAITTLTVDGVDDCSMHHSPRCQHIGYSLEAYGRRKWELAEQNVQNWGPQRFMRCGLDPRWFLRPDEIRYAPDFERAWGDDVDRLILEFAGGGLPSGFLAVFKDGGHIFISEQHPEGRTLCRKCGRRDCEHYQRAMQEIKLLEASR